MPDPGQTAAVEFNPLLPAYIDDPHPFLRQLREHDPVHWSKVYQVWVVTRYADALVALRDPRLSASSGTWQNRDKFFLRSNAPATPPIEVYRHWMLQMDPPEHTRLRGLLNKAFTSRAAEAMRSRIESIVDELLPVAGSSDTLDIVSSLAYPLPIRVICDLLGIPEADQERVKDWSHDLLPSFGPVMSARQLHQISDTMGAFCDYFERLIEGRRARPQQHLLDSLIDARDSTGRLSDRELIATCILLVFAGHLTTVQLIAAGVLALLRHPEQARRLRENSGLVASAIDEVLRFDSPLQVINRTATEDFELGGKTIQKGQMVLVSLVAANRDPDQFPGPDTFDVGRTPNRHLAFGHDCHYCAGAPLARLEAQIAIETLLRRFPRACLADQPVPRDRNLLLRGIRQLHVRLDPGMTV